MAGAARLKTRRIGFDNQILSEISLLSYSRQPTTHNPGYLAALGPTFEGLRKAGLPE